MRYEFSLVVVDEFNQTLTIQVPSNVAAAKMGMADPCNWTNKQNRYEDACKALAKFGIFDKTPNGMMTNGNFARASFVELDMVVALVRPPPPTLPAVPLSPTQPLPATSATLPLTNASAASAQASRSTTEALSSSAGVGDNRWSMTKKVLFQHDVPRVKRQRSEETSFPTMNSTTTPSPSSSSDSAIENIMELVSIQLVTSSPTPQPATPQQQHRYPSIPPPPSRLREPTPRHHTPKPPDRFR
ncbi:hypothetical protein DFQ26_001630 [Actinomortierella ambigua]|nr:hypothetical protein DFQ26_001630 [Actinomortierella ambigua]